MSRISPVLSDGRAFTSYVSSGIYNQALERQFGVGNETAYRAFLQGNADEAYRTMNALTSFAVAPPTPKPRSAQVPGAAIKEIPAQALAPSQRIVRF